MRAWVRKGVIGGAIALSATVHGITLLSSALVWAIIYLSIAQVEYDRFSDPTNQYEVVLTYPKLYRFMPAMPGQGSDKSGNIAIYDRQGNFYGGGSIDFVRDGYEIEWTENGAYLPLGGEWDFEAGTYSH